MAVGWFLAPYKRRGTKVARYCAMDDFTPQITADGGGWAEAECLGGMAVVKVNASPATLTAINAAPGFIRVPLSRLDDPLSTLTAGQLAAIKNQVLGLGYSLSELQARFPGADLTNTTLGDVLRFILTRRLQARYDTPTDTIILDGGVQTTTPIEVVDGAV